VKGANMTNNPDPDREFRFIDISEIDTSEMTDIEGSCVDVLKDALLDIIQIAEQQGLPEEEADEAVRRAKRCRRRFTLHTGDALPDDGLT